MHVAFYHHLVFATYSLNNVDVKFDANRAKIASAVSNSVYAWKKPMMTSHMTCVKYRHYDIRCIDVDLCWC